MTNSLKILYYIKLTVHFVVIKFYVPLLYNRSSCTIRTTHRNSFARYKHEFYLKSGFHEQEQRTVVTIL